MNSPACAPACSCAMRAADPPAGPAAGWGRRASACQRARCAGAAHTRATRRRGPSRCSPASR
eukprot:5804829-Pyramimonas_sp.AAC.2